MVMRAIEAKTFSGYGSLRQAELPKPQPAKDEVLIRVTAAGVTPLDHTIPSGGHPRAKAPLVLGSEGAGVVEDAGDSGLAVGSRVMFTGPYGVRENGAGLDSVPFATAPAAEGRNRSSGSRQGSASRARASAYAVYALRAFAGRDSGLGALGNCDRLEIEQAHGVARRSSPSKPSRHRRIAKPCQ
jgi:NADPH:quinone reductase-like Zn-dependent oxidoreductase